MLNKLIKRDIRAMSKLMLPLLGLILLEFLLLGTILGIFVRNNSMESIVYILGALGSGVLIMGIIGCNTALQILIFVRYYKNFFTDEGYLSFTLPATSTQHLCSKAITAIIWTVAITFSNIIALFLAGLLFTVISKVDVMPFFEQLSVFFNQFFSEYFSNLEISAVGVIILSVVTTCLKGLSSLFMMYFVITVGGLSRNNGLIKGIGIYILFNMLASVINGILNNVSEIMPTMLEVVPYAFTYLLGAVLFFCLTKYLLDKKLNLN